MSDDDEDTRRGGRDKFRTERRDRDSRPRKRSPSPDYHRNKRSRRSDERWRDTPPHHRRHHPQDFISPARSIPQSRDVNEGETQPSNCVIDYATWLLQHPELASEPDTNGRYEEFKKAEIQRLLRTFFNVHKEEEWFREKYLPGPAFERAQTAKADMRKRRLEVFTTLFHNGSLEEVNEMLDDPDPLWEAKKLELAKEAEENGAANGDSEGEKKAEEKAAMDEGDEKSAKEAEGSAETAEAETTKAEDGEEALDFEEDDSAAKDSAAAESSKSDRPSGDSERRARREPAVSCTLFIRAVPPAVGKEALTEALKDIPGFRRVAMSFPTSQSPNRMAWVTFSRAVDIGEARRQVDRLKIGENTLRFTIAPAHENLVRSTQACRGKDDHELLRDLIRKLDSERDLFTGEDDANPVLSLSDTEDDKMVIYLRIVHSFDYYSGSEFPIEDDLTNRCCTIFTRVPAPRTGFIPDPWRDRVRKRAAITAVTPEEAAAQGVKDADGAVEEFVKNNSERVKEGIINNKFFKSYDFVSKHIKTKYPDRIEQVMANEAYYANYINDPIRPFKNELRLNSRLMSPVGAMYTDEFGRRLRPGAAMMSPPTYQPQRALPSYSDLDAPQGPPLL